MKKFLSGIKKFNIEKSFPNESKYDLGKTLKGVNEKRLFSKIDKHIHGALN